MGLFGFWVFLGGLNGKLVVCGFFSYLEFQENRFLFGYLVFVRFVIVYVEILQVVNVKVGSFRKYLQVLNFIFGYLDWYQRKKYLEFNSFVNYDKLVWFFVLEVCVWLSFGLNKGGGFYVNIKRNYILYQFIFVFDQFFSGFVFRGVNVVGSVMMFFFQGLGLFFFVWDVQFFEYDGKAG